MTLRAPKNAEVLKHRAFETAELRAVKAKHRGRIRLMLEVNATRLAALLDLDDDRQLIRWSEYDSEAELYSAFERAALALAR